MTAAVVLALAGLAVLYILVGYPLLLSMVKWRTAPGVRKDPAYRPTVTAILAVHDGQDFVRAKLESLLGLDYPRQLVNILVVSDASTDATEPIVESFAGRGVSLIRAPRGGKAAALNYALAQAEGEILFFTDVRQTLHPEALAQLVANLADPTVGAVSGELRILNPDRSGEQADLDLYWRYELWARGIHSRIHSMFSVTGCIYAMRRDLVEPIPPDTLSDDVVMPQRAFRRGYRVIFEPEAVAFDYPTAAGGEFRRKLRTLAGVWQVYARMPWLFRPGGRMHGHFLSHRFARLALPWVLLAGVVATVLLPPSPARTFLLAGEVLLPLLAACDRLVPKGSPLKRLSSPAKTFLAMNAAALLSVAVFVVRPEKLWRPTKVRTG